MVQKEMILKAYNETIDLSTEIAFIGSKKLIKYDKDFLSEEEFENAIYDEYISKSKIKLNKLKNKKEISEIKKIIHKETLEQYAASKELYKIERQEQFENDSLNNEYLSVINKGLKKHPSIKQDLNEFEEMLIHNIFIILKDAEGNLIQDKLFALRDETMPGSIYHIIPSKKVDVDKIIRLFEIERTDKIKKSLMYLYENPMKFQKVKIGPFKVIETEVKIDGENGKEIKKVYAWENYIQKNNKPEGFFNISYIIEYILKEFVSTSKKYSIPMPITFTNDKNVPALSYFDKDLMIEGEYPTIKSFLSHLDKEDIKVFKAFIYSIFESKNRSRQIMVLMDEGFSGKSAFIKSLTNYIGNNICTSINNDDIKGNFFFSKTYGKRFITLSDNNNPKVTMTEKIKLMTGDDNANIEYKGIGGFMGDVYAKFILASNNMLTPANETHQKTRLVIFKLQQYSDEILKTMCEVDEDGNLLKDSNGGFKFIGGKDYKEKINDEFPAFVCDCKKDYKELCPNDELIKISHNNEVNFNEAAGLNSNEIYLGEISSLFIKEKGVHTDIMRADEILKRYCFLKGIKSISTAELTKYIKANVKKCRHTRKCDDYYKNLNKLNNNKLSNLYIDYESLVKMFPNDDKMVDFSYINSNQNKLNDAKNKNALNNLENSITNMGRNNNVDKYINSNKSVFEKVEVVEKETIKLEDLDEDL